MSSTLVGRSPDLTQLVEEEYDIEVRDGNLLVHHVPYVNSLGAVEFGILVSEVTTNGEQTLQPGRHEMWLVGGIPYDGLGQKVRIVNNENPHDFGGGLIAACSMSGKVHGELPPNYYDKVSNYVRILSGYARLIDPAVTHKGYPPRESKAEESIFRYHDAATSRAGLSAITAKLRLGRVAIVGLGGTGSYILDLVAKTPVEELYLYDDDVLYAHNAFRFPGATSLEELRASPRKVDYLFSKYDLMRRNIIVHASKVTHHNVADLLSMSFVFLAIDAGQAKRLIIEELEAAQVPFVDCGMGVQRQENFLRGVLRVTAGMEGHYSHIRAHVSFGSENDDEYDWNIQTADLNMLNAAMAVIRWKKMCGYYADEKRELNSTYTVTRNQMISGELAD